MVNSIHGKIYVPKKIINLMEDIRIISSSFKDPSIDYCSKVIWCI